MPRELYLKVSVLPSRLLRSHLLLSDPRLGFEADGGAQVKKARWFRGFNFNSLIEGTMTPPFIPDGADGKPIPEDSGEQ